MNYSAILFWNISNRASVSLIFVWPIMIERLNAQGPFDNCISIFNIFESIKINNGMHSNWATVLCKEQGRLLSIHQE